MHGEVPSGLLCRDDRGTRGGSQRQRKPEAAAKIAGNSSRRESTLIEIQEQRNELPRAVAGVRAGKDRSATEKGAAGRGSGEGLSSTE